MICAQTLGTLANTLWATGTFRLASVCQIESPTDVLVALIPLVMPLKLIWAHCSRCFELWVTLCIHNIFIATFVGT